MEIPFFKIRNVDSKTFPTSPRSSLYLQHMYKKIFWHTAKCSSLKGHRTTTAQRPLICTRTPRDASSVSATEMRNTTYADVFHMILRSGMSLHGTIYTPTHCHFKKHFITEINGHFGGFASEMYTHVQATTCAVTRYRLESDE